MNLSTYIIFEINYLLNNKKAVSNIKIILNILVSSDLVCKDWQLKLLYPNNSSKIRQILFEILNYL